MELFKYVFLNWININFYLLLSFGSLIILTSPFAIFNIWSKLLHDFRPDIISCLWKDLLKDNFLFTIEYESSRIDLKFNSIESSRDDLNLDSNVSIKGSGIEAYIGRKPGRKNEELISP